MYNRIMKSQVFVPRNGFEAELHAYLLNGQDVLSAAKTEEQAKKVVAAESQAFIPAGFVSYVEEGDEGFPVLVQSATGTLLVGWEFELRWGEVSEPFIQDEPEEEFDLSW